MRRRPLILLLTVVGAASVVIGACSDGGSEPGSTGTGSEPGASETPVVALYEGDDFYAVPEPLPQGEPGELIRLQPVEARLAADVYRMMYLSESPAGDSIAVTGLAVVPDGPPPAEGWPVLSWAHGTTGIADRCAPSHDAADLAGLAAPLIDEGWLVVATDYEGLGTPGRHPYLVGESEGRGVLDAARAVQGDARFAASARTAIWGHSQGGHGALFAAELASSWAPELDVLGAVAGAPASELHLIVAALRDGPFQGYLALAAAGLNAAHPEARLDQVLTERGIETLEVVDRACASDVLSTFAALPFDDIARGDPNEVEPWASLIAESNPGRTAHGVPVLIIHGSDDAVIPPVASEVLAERLCGLGQVLDRRVYEGAGHADVIAVALPDVLAWLDARRSGERAPDSCPA